MRVVNLSLALLIALATAQVASAQSDPWQQHRQWFLQAEQAFERGDQSAFDALLKLLGPYPLRPYLSYLQAEASLAQGDSTRISGLLSEWGDAPLALRLRTRWLQHLATQQNWDLFIENYVEQNAASLRCAYATALAETNRLEDAFDLAETLWLVGHSQASACDGLFRRWRESGKMPGDMVWRRLALSMNSGDLAMARYLMRSLGPKSKALAQLWIEVHGTPSVVSQVHRFPSTSSGQEVLLWGLRRLARNDPHAAAGAWEKIQNQRDFNEWETESINRRIGLSFAREHQSEGLLWLDRLPKAFANDDTREWALLSALREQHWSKVEALIAELPQTSQEDRRWQYWRARALEQQGAIADAQALFATLAKSRSFYGFLAADRTDVAYQFSHSTLALAAHSTAIVGEHPAILRARELYLLQRYADARREWQFATSGFERGEIIAAAKLAQHWGWHARAIITVAQAEEWNDLVLRFPLAHRAAIVAEAAKYNLDPAWLFAIARQESAFIPDVKSSAGALGVMQIMPATGRYIAKNLSVAGFQTRQLLTPSRNIEFGSWYLNDLMSNMRQQVALASAGYNAGPHRVDRWLPNDLPLPADIWIETIPFKETRKYVKRVLEYSVVYEMRLGKSQTKLSDKLTPVPPSLSLSEN